MTTKNNQRSQKALLVGAGAAIASSIAAAVALSDKKNRDKVKKIAVQLKTKAEDVLAHLRLIAHKNVKSKTKSKQAK